MPSKPSIAMRKNFLAYKLLILSLFFSIAGNPLVFACSVNSCENETEIVPPKFQRSSAIFIGKVLKIDRYDNLKDIEFKVSRVYKGDIAETVTVSSESVCFDEAVCGIDFQEGEEYLVYAYGVVSDPGDVYFVEGCGGARKLSCAGYEIGALERMTRISGKSEDN